MDKDTLLIRETLQGNKASFGKLIEDYQDYVFSVAFKILRNREEAEEVAQDTFLKAYRALSGFEFKSRFATWLYQIAWRTAIDKHRRKTPKHVSIDDDNSYLQIKDDDKTPSEELQTKNLKGIIKAAIDRLKPEDASLITLYYLNEQSVKEVCEITGLSESNVKVRLFRLRDSLKVHLAAILKTEVEQII